MTNLSKRSRRSRSREVNNTSINDIIGYTDASCRGNNTGYSFIVLNHKKSRILHIYSNYENKNCSSHRGELQAILELLKWFQSGLYEGNRLKIFTDSKYIVNSFNKRMTKWVDNEWKNNIKYKQVWKEVYSLRRAVSIRWVRGHSSDPWNILVDYLAGEKSKNGFDITNNSK